MGEILAFILGAKGENRIKSTNRVLTGKKMARTGLITGVIFLRADG
jgi:hypothetical protein